MKKSLYALLGFVLVFTLLLIGFVGTARAEINLSINIGQPQEVVMMPTGVYFVPDSQVDVFFYGGYWWTPRGNSWYRANETNGPWVVVQRNYVPGPVYRVPLKNYRTQYVNTGHRVKFRDLQKQNGPKQGGKNKGRGDKH